MKNRVLLISLVVMLALSMGLIGCGGEQVQEYSLFVSSTEGGKVTAPGEGVFVCDEGMVIDLVAEADEGYHFLNWTGLVGTVADVNDAITTIAMNGYYSITANFEEIPEHPSNLVIGMARDTDQELVLFEQIVAGPVIREFVHQVNLSGGVHLSAYDTGSWECYVPLEIDMRDFDLPTWNIGEVTAGICADINDGTVDFLFGGPATDCIVTQAPIANEAGVVLLTLEGGSPSIRTDPEKLASWPYVFISLSYSDWYQIPVLQDMLEAQLGRAPKAYVTHIGEVGAQHGQEYLQVTKDEFGEANVIDAGAHPLEVTAEDANTIIRSAIAALGDPANPNYDIFCAYTYPQNVLTLTAAAIGNDFNPPAMIFGPGANFGFYPYYYGDPSNISLNQSVDPSLLDGVMGFTVAAYDAIPEIQAVYDLIAERMDDDAGDQLSGLPGFPGILSLDYWGTPCYWAGLEMWLEAIERVGYVDQEKLRDALVALKDDPADTILGDCWFRMYGTNGEGGGNLDYLCHTGEIGQWQSGEFETVGYDVITDDLPNYVVTAEFMFPMTDKWNWLP